MPRNPAKPDHFANFGLSTEDDEDLSTWMRRRMGLALWPHSDAAGLALIETDVLAIFEPPLNIDKVSTRWRDQVKSARKVLAQEARDWRPRVDPQKQV